MQMNGRNLIHFGPRMILLVSLKTFIGPLLVLFGTSVIQIGSSHPVASADGRPLMGH